MISHWTNTGCSQFGIVFVCDKRTGIFFELSCPWTTLRLGKLRGWA